MAESDNGPAAAFPKKREASTPRMAFGGRGVDASSCAENFYRRGIAAGNPDQALRAFTAVATCFSKAASPAFLSSLRTASSDARASAVAPSVEIE